MATSAKAPKAPFDPKRVMVTPEGVDLGVELAPLSVRLAALFLDLAIMFGIMLGLTIVLSFASAAELLSPPRGTMQIIWLLGFFFLRNGWFVAWEMSPRGATPGKRIMKIRVAMRNGGRLTADAVFARNVTRELELFLPTVALAESQFVAEGSGAIGGWMALAYLTWAFIFLLLPFFNRDHLRAGDIIGGTWVVQAPRHSLKADLARDGRQQAERYAFTRDQLDTYGVMELQVLEDVLRHMDRRVLRDVAERIRKKIEWVELPGETDAEFLQAYYAALRERLEKRMLFGHRRKDKHDRTGLN